MTDIFPDKFTPVGRTVVGEAARLLVLLDRRAVSIGHLYGEYRQLPSSGTYDAFAAALTLLYGAGVLNFDDQIVRIG